MDDAIWNISLGLRPTRATPSITPMVAGIPEASISLARVQDWSVYADRHWLAQSTRGPTPKRHSRDKENLDEPKSAYFIPIAGHKRAYHVYILWIREQRPVCQKI